MTNFIPGELGETPFEDMSIFDLVRFFGSLNDVPANLIKDKTVGRGGGGITEGSGGGGSTGNSVNIIDDTLRGVINGNPSGRKMGPFTDSSGGGNNMGFEDWLKEGLDFAGDVIGGNNSQAEGEAEGNNLGIPDWLLAALFAASGAVGSQAGTSESSGSVTLDPEIAAARNRSFSGFTDILDTDPDLSGFLANTMEGNNQAAALERRQGNEILAQRGIRGPAAAFVDINANARRIGANTKTQNELPLLSRQLREGTLTGLANAVGNAPFGSTTTESVTSEGNPVGGGLAGLTGILARLRGLST